MMTKHILLVDDEVATLMAYRKLLQGPALEVDTAETIEDATGCLAKKNYHVVVADIRLTGTFGREGIDILRFVRKNCSGTKVILMTAHGNADIRNEALNLGASYYMEKPVPTRDLRKALSDLGVGQ